ncbi:UNKNOWN [Stylonychia lemnae]|uniref:Uncharacterized protein n=1 Tax=Stylonychia lemnae TaxID=5949 RepID=A0A078A3F2_STYLE|nr:UNKNOWN [Stylonychia lemnae]|eukprot:CDW76322.1 UNKNOWN [Stylonychia lemnae]
MLLQSIQIQELNSINDNKFQLQSKVKIQKVHYLLSNEHEEIDYTDSIEEGVEERSVEQRDNYKSKNEKIQNSRKMELSKLTLNPMNPTHFGNTFTRINVEIPSLRNNSNNRRAYESVTCVILASKFWDVKYISYGNIQAGKRQLQYSQEECNAIERKILLYVGFQINRTQEIHVISSQFIQKEMNLININKVDTFRLEHKILKLVHKNCIMVQIAKLLQVQKNISIQNHTLLPIAVAINATQQLINKQYQKIVQIAQSLEILDETFQSLNQSLITIEKHFKQVLENMEDESKEDIQEFIQQIKSLEDPFLKKKRGAFNKSYLNKINTDDIQP